MANTQTWKSPSLHKKAETVSEIEKDALAIFEWKAEVERYLIHIQGNVEKLSKKHHFHPSEVFGGFTWRITWDT